MLVIDDTGVTVGGVLALLEALPELHVLSRGSIELNEERLRLTSDWTDDAALAALQHFDRLPSTLVLDHCGITDAGLEHLAPLTGLRELHISSPLSGDGLRHLAGLDGLRKLVLFQSWIPDSALAHLAELAGLEELNLCGTKITDAGVEHLRGLRQLKLLDVRRTNMTEDGIAELKKFLPDLSVISGAPLASPTKASDSEGK